MPGRLQPNHTPVGHHQTGLGGLDALPIRAMGVVGGGVHERTPALGALDAFRQGAFRAGGSLTGVCGPP